MHFQAWLKATRLFIVNRVILVVRGMALFRLGRLPRWNTQGHIVIQNLPEGISLSAAMRLADMSCFAQLSFLSLSDFASYLSCLVVRNFVQAQYAHC